MTIYEQARAKINLSLDVTGRREDGYHLVRMIMQTLDLCDDLTFETAKAGAGITLITDSGVLNKEQSEGSDNLIIKAARALEKETDENGERTEDSVLAQDIYDALTNKKLKVFFSFTLYNDFAILPKYVLFPVVSTIAKALPLTEFQT